MRDENLVGLWDSGPYDYGAMESSWVCLRRDGTGWTAWANVGGGSVSRLTWACPQAGEVELRYAWTASGNWFPGTPPTLVEIDDEGPDDTVVHTRYALSLDTAPLAESPVTTLRFDESVEFCHRFGLVTREVHAADPAPPSTGGSRNGQRRDPARISPQEGGDGAN
ncbi:hypothetical protein OOK41_21910 [Micromonospora sp. NBC_01655]|uniref:hypothetical protein n=1 Tax=Micromonospora sp. NBC_01655 TaxID=2975983 RepID=UPI002252AECF|nr:hypothetical protein [Micromonospora sp. NBC_01655]MCX4472934.1 hypothetical protein [Micromonospora sp. NBC_01655]